MKGRGKQPDKSGYQTLGRMEGEKKELARETKV